jgi:hypothetical protein
MRAFLIAMLVTCGFLRGCCTETPRVEPAYPTQERGWNERYDKGVRSLGTFVLRKGQTTDNGKLQVKLLDVIPGDSCAEAGTTISRARAILQFVRLPEQKVLCEDSFVETSSMTISGTACSKNLGEFGVAGILIGDINLKEGWVFFEVRG